MDSIKYNYLEKQHCYDDRCIEIYLKLIHFREVCADKENKYCENLIKEFKVCEDKWSKCNKIRYILP